MLKESTMKKLNEYAKEQFEFAKRMNPNAEVEIVNIPIIIVKEEGKVCSMTELSNIIIPSENK